MDIAYFDNAATTYKKPKEMHDFMYNFYCSNSVNVGRGEYALSNQSNSIVSDTRKMLLSLFEGNTNYETIFTPTATEAINIILQGQEWSNGDIVYMSPFEHNAVYRTLKFLEDKYNLDLEILDIDRKTLELDFESISLQFARKKPKFVVTTHVSNVCGNIIDINKLGNIVKRYNARYMVDCAQSAGLLETSIIKCQADYMVFAGHKTLYGPFGCSGFICRKSESPKPLIYGGTGIDSANEGMPDFLPTRLEPGSVNIMSISGLYQSLKWINSVGKKNICIKERENYNKLVKILSNYNSIKIVGKGNNSTSIVSCSFSGYTPDNIGDLLSRNGIMVRTGLQCAPLAHRTLGTFPEGTVRFSISYFTNDEDFKKLEGILELIDDNV